MKKSLITQFVLVGIYLFLIYLNRKEYVGIMAITGYEFIIPIIGIILAILINLFFLHLLNAKPEKVFVTTFCIYLLIINVVVFVCLPRMTYTQAYHVLQAKEEVTGKILDKSELDDYVRLNKFTILLEKKQSFLIDKAFLFYEIDPKSNNTITNYYYDMRNDKFVEIKLWDKYIH